MFNLVENRIEISNNKPRNLQISKLRKFLPKKALRSKSSRVVNNRDKKGFGYVMRDDNMERPSRCCNGSDNSDGFMPKHNDSARKSIGEDSYPILVLGDFSTKTINSISICSGFNETNNSQFMSFNKTKNTRIGISSRDAPVVPANDFNCTHKNHENR